MTCDTLQILKRKEKYTKTMFGDMRLIDNVLNPKTASL